MKVRELSSIVVFIFVAISFFAANYNNELENERIIKETCERVELAEG